VRDYRPAANSSEFLFVLAGEFELSEFELPGYYCRVLKVKGASSLKILSLCAGWRWGMIEGNFFLLTNITGSIIY